MIFIANFNNSRDLSVIKDLFDKQIQNIKERNIEKAKNIFSILEDRLQREKKRMEDQILILRNEG